jgi:hypothetical protein
VFACSNDFYWDFVGGNPISPIKSKQIKTFMLQEIQPAPLTSTDSSDNSGVINLLVFCSIVLQSFIPIVTVDIRKLVNSALEQQLCDSSIKLHHNRDV